ncbi:phosphotransferase family protein [Leucobacter aridicollis]|uniref:phosphotransferase family protein n=1 Tax=Leucobacter aridicollis TaxID=283878 RepID=UPI00210441F4|nr:phosphotransferase family protein [Leucobacter aridicollis]UTX52241.1 phosphotransferase family protein [Leucobacter aridicollis]
MPEIPGLDIVALSKWFSVAHPELATGPLRAEVIAGGRSNLTYAITGARRPLVLRRPPLGHVLSSAHDMAREHRVISALAGTAIPVPAVVDLVDDTAGPITGTPFFLMEKAPGAVIANRTQNAEYTREEIRGMSFELVHHLAALHAVDVKAVGLASFGKPDGYLARQLSTWRRQLDASRSRELPDLERLQTTLEGGVPETARTGIVHGDYRLDNALIDGRPPRVSAILDWEMATLGDPLVDLGIFALYWEIGSLAGSGVIASAVDPAAGYPDFEELAEYYAAQAGITLPDLRWYRAFAAYKLAVILEGIHYRYQAGDTVGEGFDRIGDLVRPLAENGLKVL